MRSLSGRVEAGERLRILSDGDETGGLEMEFEKIIPRILKKVAGPYNHTIYIGPNYTIANLEEDLRNLEIELDNFLWEGKEC
jgi:hypothetical protein